MRSRVVWALGAANLLLCAVLVGVAPGGAQEPVQPVGEGGVYNCCKTSTSGTPFCCENCCWNPLGATCKSSSNCR